MKNKIEQKEIKRWWEAKRQLRWDNIYKGKDYAALKLNNRMNKILYYFNEEGKKKISILELGFGGGHLAYNLIKKGHKYKGLDISNNLVKSARDRCKKLKNKNFSFYCESIDKKLKFPKDHFDVVIICGVMQYVTRPLFTFREILRVLKKDSIFICAQSNFLVMRSFLNLRSFLNRIVCIILNEKFEVSSSYRSILLETKLKKLFRPSIKSKIISSQFFNKNFVNVNFNFKKRIIFQKKIITLGNKAGFKIIKTDSSGPFFRIGYSNKVAFLINKFLEGMAKYFIFSFLNKVNNSFIIIFKK